MKKPTVLKLHDRTKEPQYFVLGNRYMYESDNQGVPMFLPTVIKRSDAYKALCQPRPIEKLPVYLAQRDYYFRSRRLDPIYDLTLNDRYIILRLHVVSVGCIRVSPNNLRRITRWAREGHVSKRPSSRKTSSRKKRHV